MIKEVYSPTLRGVVSEANKLSLTKDNIITIAKDGNMYHLIYLDNGGQN